MLKYTSLMIQAYCNVTGKTREAALVDLSIDSIIEPKDLDLCDKSILLEELSSDRHGVITWAKHGNQVNSKGEEK